MNFHTKSFVRLSLAGSLAASFLLAGCAGPTAVTEENAPSELLKQAAVITSESDPEDVSAVFTGLIDATSKASDNRLIFSEKASGTGLKLDSEELETSENSFKNYDVRYGTDTSFYQLYEEESASEPVYGIMDSSTKTITTVFLNPEQDAAFSNPEAKMSIASIDSRESGLEDATEAELKASIDSAIVYPLYTLLGSSLVIQPMTSPENYNFKLEKNGSKYIWTISIADQKEYNKTLDDTFEETYGHDRKDIRGDGTLVLDSYDVTDVSMVLTMDKDGALSQIEAANKSTVKKDDLTKDLSSSDIVTIKQAPESWKGFFESFFKAVADGKLKENDTFTMGESFKAEDEDTSKTGSKTSDSSKASSDEDKSEDSAKNSDASKSEASDKPEAKKDSKTDSKDDSKADSAEESSSKASASSKKD